MAGQLAERADPLIDSLARVVDSAGPAAVDTIGAARERLAGPELRQRPGQPHRADGASCARCRRSCRRAAARR